MSRPPIRVVTREATVAEPIDLRDWVYAYVATIARQEGIGSDPRQDAA